MTPRFYGFLWMIYWLAAGILLLGNAFTMFTLVVFGFIIFGLIFVGMMCVLPGVVAHPPAKREKVKFSRDTESTVEPVSLPTGDMRHTAGLRYH
jgi:hypothetical protein